MIDAYTIGITLALEDGVSDGIAVIRRDLAELDAAVAESAARLQVLRKLAEGLSIPTPPKLGIEEPALFAPALFRQKPGAVTPPAVTASTAERPVTAASDEPDRDRRSVVTQPVFVERPASTPPSPPSVQIAPIMPAPRQAMPDRPEPSAPSPAKPLLEPWSVPLTAKQPPVDLSAVARMLMPTTPTSPPPALPLPASGAPIRQAPVPSLPEQPTRAPVALTPSGAAPVQRGPVTISLTPDAIGHQTSSTAQVQQIVVAKSDGPEPLWTPPRSPAASAQAAGAPIQKRPPVSTPSATPSRSEASPMLPRGTGAVVPPIPPKNDQPRAAEISIAPREPIAPIEPSRSRALTRPIENLEQRHPAQASPPSLASQPMEQPVVAELHLDGAALGRWITRHLERHVTRPQVGVTGFDPRMTPSWPGAPIGN